MHFLMDGGFRLNGKKIDSEMGGEANEATLRLHFATGDILAFNKSSASIRNISQVLSHIDELQSLDICSERFSHSRAVSRCIQQKDRPVCDVLLDQNILPGVGNIIKNEALFDSGVMPDCNIDVLNEKQINHLIKMTRDFSMIFYKCRRDGKPLWPYLKIYNKDKCKECQSSVIKTKMGCEGGRLTWFCPKCQSKDPANIKLKLPTKNSLLGWVNAREESHRNDSWSCPACTFHNKEARSECEICLNPKPTDAAILLDECESDTCRGENSEDLHIQASNNKTSTSSQYSGITKPSTIALPSMSDSAGSTKRKWNSDNTNLNGSPARKLMRNENNQRSKSGVSSTCGPKQSNKHNVKEYGTEDGVKARRFCLQPSNEEPSKFAAPFCHQHNVKCRMQQVHKEGTNHNRMFWCCTARKKCSFFKWADENFPICEGHGKLSVLRTVLKQGPNNGKKFFACPLPKSKQCGFFEWAVGLD